MRTRPASIWLVTLLLACAYASPARAQTTALFFDSQPGEFIGGGPPPRTFTTANATFTAVREGNAVRIVVDGASLTPWHVSFVGADNLPLAVGTYSSVRAAAFAAPFNGLSVSGDGRGCSDLTGRFVVREIEYSGEDVTRFAADFEQHCNDFNPALFGAIRYNSTISELTPFGGVYPVYRLTLTPPTNGRVTGDGFDCGGPGITCERTLTSAASVVLTAKPDPGHIFGGWTEDCHGGTTTSVRINSVERCGAIFLPALLTAPRTLLNWNSSPGDYIGQGKREVYAPWNSHWTVRSTHNRQGLEITIASLDDIRVSRWTLAFDAPNGQILQAGTNYTGATRDGGAAPMIDVHGNGAGCSNTRGEFKIRQLVFGAGDSVERLALDFIQRCEQTFTPPLTGALQYNSTIDKPKMTLDKTSLRFAATTNGMFLTHGTSPQTVVLAQDGPGTVTWTAASNQPWLTVTPASGTGSGELSVWIASGQSLPLSGETAATITVTLTGSVDTVLTTDVIIRTFPDGTTSTPFGLVETPSSNLVGITGAIPITGWALDDVEVTNVYICRAPLPSEGRLHACGGRTLVTIGTAALIDGARLDVQAAFPSAPRASRAGWGFMLLTNMLPNQGNGTYAFSVYAQDREGNMSLLGERTLTVDNANATRPFGAIDTPTQGGLASGSSFVNFGWALTPQTKTIPFDGSTISVLVDGVSQGNVSYDHFRSDIASLFPGLNNSNGAVGFKILDTTSLANGTHTISWIVTDDQGVTEGIGSRFFTVANGTGALTGAATQSAARQRLRARVHANIEALPLDRTPIRGRRGWDLASPLRAFDAGDSGRTVVRSEEVSRVELHVGPGPSEGYLRTSEGLAALPIGSKLDPDTGVFTWAPGVGFVGAYDLVFVRQHAEEPAARREVRIVLHPKGSAAGGPQVVIDTPRWQQDVGQPFVLAGWAADVRATEGTGIATLHAWAYPLAGGPPVFLGVSSYGGARPDVAGVHGAQFTNSGFGLVVHGLPHGHYDLAVFAWSTLAGDFVPAAVVRATVR
jgi:hypothetical protein